MIDSNPSTSSRRNCSSSGMASQSASVSWRPAHGRISAVIASPSNAVMLPRRTDVPRWNGTSGRLGAWNPTGCSTSTRRRRRPPPVEPPPATAPLAVRMRPRTLDEVVGQAHLLRPGAPLRRLVEGGTAASVLLYGPPGTGKTTIARLLAGVRRAALRRALGAVLGGAGAAPGDRGRPAPARPAQPPDRAVHRRGPPLLQDPAGRAAGRGGGPPRAAGRRDHREPVVLGGVAAAVALAGAAAGVAHRGRRARPAAPGRGRRARARRGVHRGARRRGRARPPRRRRRPARAHRAGGGRRRRRGHRRRR